MGDSLRQRIRKRVPANVSVIKVRETLRLLLADRGLREVARPSVFRTARRYPYRGRGRMLRALGPDLASMTTWSAVDTELHGEMAEISSYRKRILPSPEGIESQSYPATRELSLGNFGEEAEPHCRKSSLLAGNFCTGRQSTEKIRQSSDQGGRISLRATGVFSSNSSSDGKVFKQHSCRYIWVCDRHSRR